MKVKVISAKGTATANEVSLSKEVFGIEPNDHAIYLDVKQHLANRRQGTHKAKERAEIQGSTRKIKKQKGTGGARAGSIKSGTRVGGGRIFGPRPRNYHFKLNVKLKRLARKSAFSYKAKAKDIMVIEDLKFDAIKTKDFETLLSNLKLQNDKTAGPEISQEEEDAEQERLAEEEEKGDIEMEGIVRRGEAEDCINNKPTRRKPR